MTYGVNRYQRNWRCCLAILTLPAEAAPPARENRVWTLTMNVACARFAT